MIKPTIHLNGTSPEALRDQLRVARDATGKALFALLAASPADRDYYPQGEAAVSAAHQEHRARCDRVRLTLAEIGDLLDFVESEIEERKRQQATR